ncbi:GNAT family N-acetyltransferase [Novosphingobium sp. 9]|uniref:GNAT family N-acetyltransferase n=1 Tax=Novosphingobium sp. 9 TaxID=2025349 RepID=UPI0021B54D9E|nr:GNAT family N-acetyltransferase [Novosphingobium sp. 9]
MTDPAAATVHNSTVLTTRAGLALDIRSARASDIIMLVDFFDRVSEDDRRFRFLSGVRHIGPVQLQPIIHTDHFRTESWLAFDHANGRLVASGVLACDGPLENAEVAVSICGSHRGLGIGWAMLDFLAEQAARRGCRRVFSIESRDNRAAIELEQEKGFVSEVCDDDPALVVLSRDLR